MKNYLKLFVAAAAALFCIFSAPGATLETGAEVPELDLRAWLSGKPVNLANLKGKKAIVVVGGGSMKRFGFLDKVERCINDCYLWYQGC